jgi:hypothetical protein
MRLRRRLENWWLGMDNLDRLSIVALVFMLSFVAWFMAFLMGVI